MDQLALSECTDFVRKYWPEDAALPKHEKLRLAFTKSIQEGYWPVGARLPTEQVLVSATPCSLGTVQRALRALVADGIVIRRRGSGTIVARLNGQLNEPWHMRFPDPDGPKGTFLPVFTRVVGRTLVEERGPWNAAIGEGGPVLRIDRVFSVDNQLDIYAIFYALADRFPEFAHLPQGSLDGENFKTLIARRHHIPVHKVKQKIRLGRAPAEAVEHGVFEAGEPVMHLVVVAYSLAGEPMYYQEFYIPQTDMALDLGSAVRTWEPIEETVADGGPETVSNGSARSAG